MWAALVGLGGVLVGLAFGYFSRLTEFLRDRRLDAYSEFAGAFLAAAHAGAALVSAGASQGEAFFSSLNQDRIDMNRQVWESFGAAAQSFETATTRLRLLASDSVLTEAEILEKFIQTSIRDVHPVRRDTYPIVAPSEIDSGAIRLARDFAVRSQGEVTRWRRSQSSLSAGKTFTAVLLALLLALAVFFGARWGWQRHEAEVATQRQIATTTLHRDMTKACIADIYSDSLNVAEAQGEPGASEADVNKAYQVMLDAISRVPKWKALSNAKPSGEGLIRIDNYCHAQGFNQARHRWPQPPPNIGS
jgi:hypothetical protein